VAQGLVDAGVLDHSLNELGADPLVLHEHFLGGAPLTDVDLAKIVDEIIIPLLRPQDVSRRPPRIRSAGQDMTQSSIAQESTSTGDDPAAVEGRLTAQGGP